MSFIDAKQKVRPEQRRAADILLAGGIKQKAAKAAGVSIRTIERWHHDDAFADYLRAGAGKSLQTAAIRITSLLDLALQVFYESMTTPGQRQGIKLHAANYPITHALKLIEINDILQRLDAIEERLK